MTLESGISSPSEPSRVFSWIFGTDSAHPKDPNPLPACFLQSPHWARNLFHNNSQRLLALVAFFQPMGWNFDMEMLLLVIFVISMGFSMDEFQRAGAENVFNRDFNILGNQRRSWIQGNDGTFWEQRTCGTEGELQTSGTSCQD